MKKETQCQSCGMPMKKDNLRGTEKDGSLNLEYCIHCYQDGSFTNPNITQKEMKDFMLDYMKKNMKIPKFIGKCFTLGMKNLKRWK